MLASLKDSSVTLTSASSARSVGTLFWADAIEAQVRAASNATTVVTAFGIFVPLAATIAAGQRTRKRDRSCRAAQHTAAARPKPAVVVWSMPQSPIRVSPTLVG